ncbi:MAG: hypothetical protein DRJ40_00625 [Thermoprotei archaeon]|nr:MAG: hypothetical protein DRJ40_00625 [Thermoprotei archaeon]
MLKKVVSELRLVTEFNYSLRFALEVDNVDLPEKLELLQVMCQGNELIIKVIAKDLGTLRNTVNDVLRCLYSAMSTLQSLNVDKA